MNKFVSRFFIACVPLVGLAACGGGDTADRLDVADPAVRFVDASAIAPNVTLYRGSVAQADATDVGYGYASDYFDVAMGASDWSVKTVVADVTLGTVSIDPERGTKYTIVALPASSVESGVYLIVDPYNKALPSDSARLRLMNASFNAGNIDLYMTAPGASIAGATPTIAGTAYKTSGPASGNDSFDIAGGTYDVTITDAGTKTVLFAGKLAFAANKDVLILSVPDSLRPGGIKALVKIEGTPGTDDVPVR